MIYSQKPTPATGFILEQIDDELIIFHPGKLTTIYANNTGALVWQLCNGENSVDDIIIFLSETYPNATKTIGDDVQETIQKLVENGALLL